ncbi:hypothetical protein R1flu_025349 [Riccia fluitans]|uniref:Uncharacterized protein n=1 Tax=Riccia fluitans TaxID=41844 RepID=A0ABD1XXH4_9MARC
MGKFKEALIREASFRNLSTYKSALMKSMVIKVNGPMLTPNYCSSLSGVLTKSNVHSTGVRSSESTMNHQALAWWPGPASGQGMYRHKAARKAGNHRANEENRPSRSETQRATAVKQLIMKQIQAKQITLQADRGFQRPEEADRHQSPI